MDAFRTALLRSSDPVVTLEAEADRLREGLQAEVDLHGAAAVGAEMGQALTEFWTSAVGSALPAAKSASLRERVIDLRRSASICDTELTSADIRRFNTVPVQAVYSVNAGTDGDGTQSYDMYGNPEGVELGVPEGARGCTIVILQCYLGHAEDRLSYGQLVKYHDELRRMGFRVKSLFCSLHGTPVGIGTRMVDTVVPTQEDLAVLLDGASQCWLFTGDQSVLSDECVKYLVRQWRFNAVALHILADNPPYIGDANKVLAEMGLPLFGTSWNYYGDRMISKMSGVPDLGLSRELTAASVGKNTIAAVSSTKGGLVHCEVTTGIVTLYEGVTVAEVVLPDELDSRVHPVMFNSRGACIGYFVPMSHDTGTSAVFVHGGFTTYLFNQHLAGIRVLIRNIAVKLAIGDDTEVFNSGRASAAAGASAAVAAAGPGGGSAGPVYS
jgi:hypothetical protein